MFRCASCNKSEFTEYAIIDGYTLLVCDYCGLMLTKATDKQIKKYVASKYNKQYAINYRQALTKLYKRFEYQLNLIEKLVSGGKLLDIGCGPGYFLKYLLSKRDKFEVWGVEPNKLLRNVASKNVGKPIVNGLLSKIPYESNNFDIITCYDVLEHNIDLNKNIKELRRVLRPGGLLLVQAPNYKSFMAYITGKRWDWWCIPDHVVHFSYDFLTKYFETNGFRILKSYTYEDQEDFMSNIKGLFSANYFTKACFLILIPLFFIIERIGWMTNRGGLTVVLAQKI